MGDRAKGRCTAQRGERLELALLFVLQVHRGSCSVLHTGASLRAGRGTAGGSWQRAGAAQPQAASEDPALSPQSLWGRGGMGQVGKQRNTCGTGLEVKTAVGGGMEGHLLHGDSFAVT